MKAKKNGNVETYCLFVDSLAFVDVMDRSITIIVLLFVHLQLFVSIFDNLKTGPRSTLFGGEPWPLLLTGQLSRRLEWPLNGGSTVIHVARKPQLNMETLARCNMKRRLLLAFLF